MLKIRITIMPFYLRPKDIKIAARNNDIAVTVIRNKTFLYFYDEECKEDELLPLFVKPESVKAEDHGRWILWDSVEEGAAPKQPIINLIYHYLQTLTAILKYD